MKAGREAAREVEEQLPILRDDGVDDYVERIGPAARRRYSRRIPASEFRYTFDVVNVSDINAFALPGGPMYINRGMLEAAKNEGEVAGVLAHEISHVALAPRHGAGGQGDAISGWFDPRTDRGRGSSAASPVRRSRWARSSASARRS